MENRECLKADDEIALSRTEDGSNKTRFRVRSVVGQGGSAICYKAFSYN
jgi:hypothetical protein